MISITYTLTAVSAERRTAKVRHNTLGFVRRLVSRSISGHNGSSIAKNLLRVPLACSRRCLSLMACEFEERWIRLKRTFRMRARPSGLSCTKSRATPRCACPGNFGIFSA